MPVQSLPLRCVTIDVEEYYHIEAGYGRTDRARWDEFPTRAERNVDLLLQLFEEHNQHGTFFILGDVARHRPKMVRHIAEAGHEIASHGMNHDRLHRLDCAAFSEDVSAGKTLLEDQTGGSVIGYRTPTLSIVHQTAWAIDALLACGFTYDASIFPVRHPWYGVPDAPHEPFMVRSRYGGEAILEVPPLV